MSETATRDDKRLNPNSALYWLPAAVEAADFYDELHVPETEIIEFDFMDSLMMLEGARPDSFPWGELDTAACELGWPVFIRTDLSSAKHDGLDGVQAAHADAVEEVAVGLVRDAAKKMMRSSAFLVREWIDIDSEFEAFDGLPIGVEFRVFATPDEALCTHYYWPEDSIEKASLPERCWQIERDHLEHARKPGWMDAAAMTAAFEADFQHGIDVPGRAWSVDFARDESGDWYLIDMALAEDSWHAEDCEAEWMAEPDGGESA